MFSMKFVSVFLMVLFVGIVCSFPHDETIFRSGEALARTKRAGIMPCGDGMSCTGNSRCSKTDFGHFCETTNGNNMCVLSQHGHTCGLQCGCSPGGCWCGDPCSCNKSGGCQCTA